MKLIRFSILLAALTVILSCSHSNSSKESTSGAAVQITKAEFVQKVFDFEKNKEWKYQGSIPCIVDFYADWCRPCKMIGPYLEELGKNYAGKIIVYKVNVDQEKELAAAFRIESIPAVLFVPMTGEPHMSVGALAKEEYEKEVKTTLLGGQAIK